jgi:hypothetical protein
MKKALFTYVLSLAAIACFGQEKYDNDTLYTSPVLRSTKDRN